MYRPEGWDNPYMDIDEGRQWLSYEAGADAYEEGLKKGAIHIRTKRGWEYLKDSYEGWLHGDEVGYIVFIKEEKR